VEDRVSHLEHTGKAPFVRSLFLGWSSGVGGAPLFRGDMGRQALFCRNGSIAGLMAHNQALQLLRALFLRLRRKRPRS